MIFPARVDAMCASILNSKSENVMYCNDGVLSSFIVQDNGPKWKFEFFSLDEQARQILSGVSLRMVPNFLLERLKEPEGQVSGGEDAWEPEVEIYLRKNDAEKSLAASGVEELRLKCRSGGPVEVSYLETNPRSFAFTMFTEEASDEVPRISHYTQSLHTKYELELKYMDTLRTVCAERLRVPSERISEIKVNLYPFTSSDAAVEVDCTFGEDILKRKYVRFFSNELDNVVIPPLKNRVRYNKEKAVEVCQAAFHMKSKYLEEIKALAENEEHLHKLVSQHSGRI